MADTMQLSNSILPPILEYSYPSFQYFDDYYEFIIRMSVINDIDDFDFIQVRVVSADSNNEGLNVNNSIIQTLDHTNYYITLPKGAGNANLFGYFEKTNPTSSDAQITVHMKTSTSERSGKQSIFNIYVGDVAVASNFKFQCRFGKNQEVSDWSNAAIIRVNTGIKINILPVIVGEDGEEDNIAPITVNQTSILWEGRYETGGNNSDEVVDQYYFTLDDREGVHEESGAILINDYELPSYKYRFRAPLEDGKTYDLTFGIETNYGYSAEITRTVIVDIPYQRTFDVFSVNSNSDLGYNEISIDVKDIFVQTGTRNEANGFDTLTNDIPNSQIPDYFLKDDAMNAFVPSGEQVVYSHFRTVPLTSDAQYGSVTSEDGKFSTSNLEDFSVILSVTNIKVYNSELEALRNPCNLFQISNKSNNIISNNSLNINIGAVGSEDSFYLIITEEEYGLKNIYRVRGLSGGNKELFLILKKKGADLICEAVSGSPKWIDNSFENGGNA